MNALLAEMTRQLRGDDAPPLTLDALQDAVSYNLLTEKQPEQVVAAILQREAQAISKNATNNESIPPSFNPASNFLLLPYLAEAGLCSGDVWGAQGMTCGYSNAAPGAARFSGDWTDPASGEQQQIKSPPRGSALERILQQARSEQLIALGEGGKVKGAMEQVAQHLRSVSISPIATATAQTLPQAPAGSTEALAVQFEKCTQLFDTTGSTFVVRLDPSEFALALWLQTFARISVTDDNAWMSLVVKTLIDLALDETVDHFAADEQKSLSDRQSGIADERAREQCKHLQGAAFEDCYFRVYKEKVKQIEAPAVAINMLLPLAKFFIGDLVIKNSGIEDPTNGHTGQRPTTKQDQPAPRPGSDSGLPGAGTWLGVAGAAALPFARLEIYGEFYALLNAQYAALESDQVFLVYPFGYRCQGAQCSRIPDCVSHYVEDPLACANRFAERGDWEIRPRGGYIEHSINTCLVQVQDYKSRVPYQYVRNRERTSSDRSTGLPYNAHFQTRHQTPRTENEDPNRCDADDATEGFVRDGAASAPGLPDLQTYLATLTASAQPQVKHVCPRPTEEQGPTAPTPPPLGAQVRSVDATLAGEPAREQIPFWRWRFEKVRTSPEDYSLIFAGLTSTKTLYETATVVPVAGYAFPQCELTREFNGKRSKSGHAFWAWHGEANEKPQPSPVVASIMGAAARFYFWDVRDYKPYGEAAYRGLLAGSIATGLAAETGKAYGYDSFPFSAVGDLCGNGENTNVHFGVDYHDEIFDALTPGGERFYAMPEVNLILAQAIDHEPKLCYEKQRGQGYLRVLDTEDYEGRQGTQKKFDFVVERTGDATAAASVEYATRNATAMAGSDYEARSGHLSFEPGETEKTIQTTVHGDADVEANEEFVLALSSPAGARLDQSEARGRILADEIDPSSSQDVSYLSVNAPSQPEGELQTSTMEFVIQRGGSTSRAVTIDYTTLNLTATSGTDFQARNGRITFAPGESRKVVGIPIYGDYAVETDEQFALRLSVVSGDAIISAPYDPNATNGSPSYVDALGTIQNDDETFTVTVANASVAEGESGTSALEFVATRTGTGRSRLPLYYSTADGTAKSGQDYVGATNAVVYFEPTETRKTFAVQVTGDAVIEPTETLTVNAFTFNGSGSTQSASATGTIINDDAPGIVALSAMTYAVDEAAGQVTITVNRSNGRGNAASVVASTVNGTAVAGQDYTATTRTLNWAAGDGMPKTFAVPITNDTLNENAEDFTVRLTSVSGATSGTPATAAVTISDNDAAPTVQFSTSSQTMVESATSTVTVTLSAASSKDVTVPITTTGSASSGADYTPVASPIVIPAGQTTRVLSLVTTDDTAAEGDETLNLVIGAPTNASAGTPGTHAVTIQDNERGSLALSAATYSIGEAAGSLTVTVTRSGGAFGTASVKYATSNGSALSGSDFSATSGTLNWAAGDVAAKTFVVPIANDTIDEVDETFGVSLSGAVGAALSTPASATATISDDDNAPSVQFSAASQVLTEGATATVVFTLSAPSSLTVTAPYSVSGTVTGTADYSVVGADPVSFAPGVTVASIQFRTVDDAENEGDETAIVVLGVPTNALLGSPAQQTLTVTDNERGNLAFNAAGYTIGEAGGAVTVTVARTGGSFGAASVKYAASNGSAVAGADYTAVSGTLNWASGDGAAKTFVVPILEDGLNESGETFNVALSAASGATLGTPSAATVTITDNDNQPAMSINSVSAVETNAGTNSALTFTISLSAPSGQTVSGNFVTADGTATVAGGDYLAGSGAFSFSPGVTTRTLSVTTRGDNVDEADETLQVQLSNPTNATLGTATGTGTIVDNDAAPTVSIGNVSAAEGGLGSGGTLRFPVTLSAASGQAVSVNYATTDGTATAVGLDYLPANGTLNFAPGITSQTINVSINGDGTDEPNETMSMRLTAPANAVLGTSNGVGTLLDDDPP